MFLGLINISSYPPSISHSAAPSAHVHLARGPSVRGDRKTDIGINIIRPINIISGQRRHPVWPATSRGRSSNVHCACERGRLQPAEMSPAINRCHSDKALSMSGPWLWLTDWLAGDTGDQQNFKVATAIGGIIIINHNRRPAMHEQLCTYGQCRWVGPLSNGVRYGTWR